MTIRLVGIVFLLASLSGRAADVDFSAVTCGEFVSTVDRDAKTNTAAVVGAMTWLMGYATAKAGGTKMAPDGVKPFFSMLFNQCAPDPSQPLLMLVEKVGITLLRPQATEK